MVTVFRSMSYNQFYFIFFIFRHNRYGYIVTYLLWRTQGTNVLQVYSGQSVCAWQGWGRSQYIVLQDDDSVT